MISCCFVGTVEKETTVLPTDGITQSGKHDQNPSGNKPKSLVPVIRLYLPT